MPSSSSAVPVLFAAEVAARVDAARFLREVLPTELAGASFRP